MAELTKENKRLYDDLVHLARLSLTGKTVDVAAYVKKLAYRYRNDLPTLSEGLTNVLRSGPSTSSPLRQAATPVPVDQESRLGLADVSLPSHDDLEPILGQHELFQLSLLIEERQKRDQLINAHLDATRTVLFIGEPGVGKSMAAKWIAASLSLPLITLDLSSVMSSLLGKTGVNLRHVLDYARQQDCVVFLDEIDAIAKRRDDPSDVGELKRLVTVLLQQIDQWPTDAGLLIAATNHPDLLDPAIWRRFETVIEFPLPGEDARKTALARFSYDQLDQRIVEIVARHLDGFSFGDIETMVNRARRAAALGKGALEGLLIAEIAGRSSNAPLATRKRLAVDLVDSGILSQRQISELTGLSRDTIRKHDRERASLNG